MLRRHVLLWAGMAVGVALEFAVSSELLVRLVVAPHDLMDRHRQFLADARSPDAIFGDSHASLGFTGADGFVNLAFPGENLATIVGKARRYYRDRAPERVILQADPSMLSPVRDHEAPVSYADVGEERRWLRIAEVRHRTRLIAYWRVWFKGEGFQTSRRFESDGAQTRIGSLADLAPAERDALALEEVAKQRPPESPDMSPGVRALSDIVGWLKSRGARVCLVGFPMAPDYRRHADDRPAFVAARKAFAEIAARYDVPYRDYYETIDDLSLFVNADHLNRAGAFELTPAIVRACFLSGD